MKKNSLTCLFFLLVNCSFGQILEIAKGYKIKRITQVNKIGVGNTIIMTNGFKQTLSVEGYYNLITKDSVQLKYETLRKNIFDNNCKNISSMTFNPTNLGYITFAKNDIKEIKIYNPLNTKETLLTTGGVLSLVGVITLLNALIVSGSSKKTLLYSGLGEIGAGIICISLGSSKTYRFGNSTRNWSIK